MPTVQHQQKDATEQLTEQFSTNSDSRVRLRKVESSIAESELRLRVEEVSTRITRLEDAKNVTQELWESVISV
jgi:hypothetical protein